VQEAEATIRLSGRRARLDRVPQIQVLRHNTNIHLLMRIHEPISERTSVSVATSNLKHGFLRMCASRGSQHIGSLEQHKNTGYSDEEDVSMTFHLIEHNFPLVNIEYFHSIRSEAVVVSMLPNQSHTLLGLKKRTTALNCSITSDTSPLHELFARSKLMVWSLSVDPRSSTRNQNPVFQTTHREPHSNTNQRC
jgi:hypothetical protein